MTDIDLRRATIRAFRVVIGSTFAVALFLLVMGGLMHMSGPDPDQSVGQWLYYFTGIAFVAGFSERLAQDMLAIPEQRFAGTSPDRDPVPRPRH